MDDLDDSARMSSSDIWTSNEAPSIGTIPEETKSSLAVTYQKPLLTDDDVPEIEDEGEDEEDEMGDMSEFATSISKKDLTGRASDIELHLMQNKRLSSESFDLSD